MFNQFINEKIVNISQDQAACEKLAQQDYSFGSLENQERYDYRLVLESARGHWPQILESFGIDRVYLKNKHGACPICGGKDRFRFDDQEQGMFFCNRCGAGKGVKLLGLYHGWNFSETIKMIAKQLRLQRQSFVSLHGSVFAKKDYSTDQYNAHNATRLENVWNDAQPLSCDDPADRYLKRRGITLDIFPTSLRYHHALPYYEDKKLIGKFPALLGKVTNPKNLLISIHRIYLDSFGNKARVPSPKKLMSAIYRGALNGSAIRLFEPINDTLAIGEGIETVLAFHIATKLPVWATISSNGLKHIVLPQSVSDIVILVDNDKSKTGQNAALYLSQRLLKEGRKVRRVIPPKVDFDFNDVLLEGSGNGC